MSCYTVEQRAEIIADLINKTDGADVVFGCVGDDMETVYYSYKCRGWPAIVNFLQGLCQLEISESGLSQVKIYHSSAMIFTGMCRGMIGYFNALATNAITTMATPQDRITELLRVRADPPAFKLRYVLLNPVDVVGRVKLKSFIKAQAGPAPGVSLFSAEAGHYHRLYMGLAYRYAGQRADNIGHTYGQRGIIFGNLKRHGHSIAAVLANSHGQVLAIALNTKAANATFHAEVNLVQAYMDQNLAFRKREEQFVIYTTLKPCKMCAGMIASAFPKAMVIYSQEDTGSHAKDISEPLGRVRQISDVVWNETGEHAKGLFTYDSADLNAEKGPDVSNFLAGMRKDINGRFGKDYSLTVVLDTAEAARRMMEASLTIERKVKVYGAKNIKSPRQIGVDKVLGHIAPLLAGV